MNKTFGVIGGDRRQAELARISGGAAVTEALLQSAGELLDAAAAYREGLA